MRGLILALSIIAMVDSAHLAEAGLSSKPRETSAPATTAMATDAASQETEDQIGLTRAKRRDVQRRLSSLGFETKVNGKFDESTRAVIARWQEERGYPATGFLNAAQHKEMASAAAEARKADRPSRRRVAGRPRSSPGVGGPIGAIGGAMHRVVGGIFRR
ncbi:peptidoglycan-binding domain-containing protein [Bradyrhizobium sp. HKCCYLRH3099]|uniref:peptidoglycan-binding domain-containing protein n=1 Tax=unclassified Bradyrhizobium TaxID=2631580 RepID=UPI003EBDAA72